MDPNAALTEIREIVSLSAVDIDESGPRLAELIEGLDAWLSTGGFLPNAWEGDRAASVRTAERAKIAGEIHLRAEEIRRQTQTKSVGAAIGTIIDDVADKVNVMPR